MFTKAYRHAFALPNGAKVIIKAQSKAKALAKLPRSVPINRLQQIPCNP